jgi:hypothetical protein
MMMLPEPPGSSAKWKAVRDAIQDWPHTWRLIAIMAVPTLLTTGSTATLLILLS